MRANPSNETKEKRKRKRAKGKSNDNAKRDTTVYINANIDGGLAKYINHSCNPNCKLVQWYVEGLPHLCFFARRKIKRGTELTFIYNWTKEKGKKRTVCSCGETICYSYIEK